MKVIFSFICARKFVAKYIIVLNLFFVITQSEPYANNSVVTVFQSEGKYTCIVMIVNAISCAGTI
jgi:hypothetical protein